MNQTMSWKRHVTPFIHYKLWLFEQDYEDDELKFTVFYVYFGLALLQWIILCFAETYPDSDEKVCNTIKYIYLKLLRYLDQSLL